MTMTWAHLRVWPMRWPVTYRLVPFQLLRQRSLPGPRHDPAGQPMGGRLRGGRLAARQEKGIDPGRIGLLGVSVGGGVVVQAAAVCPQIRCVVAWRQLPTAGHGSATAG